MVDTKTDFPVLIRVLIVIGIILANMITTVAPVLVPALIFSIVEKVPAEEMTALYKIAAYAAAGGIIYFISVGISVGLSYVVLFIINSIKSN